jgi:pyruvate formate lyase activating enzyme
MNKHIELVTNLVSDINDDMPTLINIADWINSLSAYIPWHVTSFYPTFEFKNKSHIDKSLLHQFGELKKTLPLHYIYTKDAQTTLCPYCKKDIITRNIYRSKNISQEGTCSFCQKEVPYLYV